MNALSSDAPNLNWVVDRFGERFLRTLALDGLCALVEPASAEARRGETQEGPEFHRLIEHLKPLADNPSGVGLDVRYAIPLDSSFDYADILTRAWSFRLIYTKRLGA